VEQASLRALDSVISLMKMAATYFYEEDFPGTSSTAMYISMVAAMVFWRATALLSDDNP
jgi:hypothetical protein